MSIQSKKYRATKYSIFLYIFVLAGLGFIDKGIFIQNKESEARRWPTAQATILESELIIKRGSKNKTYAPSVRFSYQVAGRTYSGSHLYAMWDYGSSNNEEMSMALSPFPKGAQVSVHYNPDTPEEAYLNLDNPIKNVLIAFGLVWFSFGVLITSKDTGFKDSLWVKYLKILLVSAIVTGIFFLVCWVAGMQLMSWLTTTITLIFGLMIGLGMVFRWFSTLEFKRKVENIPTSRIATGAVGDNVEIVGKIINGNKKFKSPLEGVPCSFYFIKFQGGSSKGKDSQRLLGEYGVQPWLCVDDGSGGLAMVIVKNVELQLNWSPAYKGWGKDRKPFLKNVCEILKPQLQKQAYSEFISIMNFCDFSEAVVAPQDNIYILGYAQSGQDFLKKHRIFISSEHKEKARWKLYTDRKATQKWDKNKDGVLDEDELAIAIGSVAKELAFPFIRKDFAGYLSRIKMFFKEDSEEGKTVTLSNKSERKLAKDFNWASIESLFGGGVITVNSLVGIAVLVF